MNAAVRRVLRKLSHHDRVDEGLAALSESQLRTLLLQVFRLRERPLRSLLVQQREQPAVWPGPLDARVNHALEGLVWDALDPRYVGVALAPVGPFASHRVLAGTPQDNLATGSRALEVVGDPTVQLALQAAMGRDREPVARLASVSRALRMQPLASPMHTQHFQIACLLTSGRAVPEEQFEAQALAEQLTSHLRLVRVARERYAIGPVRLALTDMRLVRALALDVGVELSAVRPSSYQVLEQAGLPRFTDDLGFVDIHAGLVERLERLRARLEASLRPVLPDLTIGFDPGRARQATYYTGFAFHLQLARSDGSFVPVIDGGFVDWVARLRSDRRERTLTSGAGIELLHRLFEPA